MFGIAIIYLLLCVHVCISVCCSVCMCRKWKSQKIRMREREKELVWKSDSTLVVLCVYTEALRTKIIVRLVFSVCCVVSTELALRQPWQPQKHYALFKWNGARYFNMWIFQFNVFFLWFVFRFLFFFAYDPVFLSLSLFLSAFIFTHKSMGWHECASMEFHHVRINKLRQS